MLDDSVAARHDKMIRLVEAELTLHREQPMARTPHDKALIERQTSATDKQIDLLVYVLCGPKEEEIRMVEGSAE